MSKKPRRVLIIGVDGGTLDLIQPMIARGRLPTLARLMQEGVWGTLRSTIPNVSPVAWASFMTGQNPGKHGILDFTYPSRGDPTSRQRLPVNGSVLHGNTLWQILSDADRTVGVINVPVTFPPTPVNGYLISGFPMPIRAKNYSYPAFLAAELEAHGWNLGDIAVDPPNQDRLEDYLAGLYRREEERIQATLWLMDRYDTEFVMVHLFETDRIQHALFNQWARWTAGDKDRKSVRYGPEMEKFFEQIDQDIQRLCHHLEQTTVQPTVLIMSDHGFGPTLKAAHPHNVLRKSGLMQLKQSPGVTFRRGLARVGLTPVNVYRLLPASLRSMLHREQDVTHLEKDGTVDDVVKKGARLLRRIAKSVVLSYDDVDWKRTRAYCLGNSGIIHVFVNLQGRERHGCVPPSAYEEVRTEIIAALREWRDPADDQPVVSEIYRCEDIYEGPFVGQAADVLATLRGDSMYFAFNGPQFLSNQLVDQRDHRDRANHCMNGFFILKDDRLAPGLFIDQARIIDLLPTVLYLMGEPIPSNLDGVVMGECFSPQWIQTHPTQIATTEGLPLGSRAVGDNGYTSEEEASILEMLRDLGYVD